MSVQIIPYSVDKFNQIPDLEDSDIGFHILNGEVVVWNILRRILFEHKMHDIFAFRLLHKFANLGENEKLVELNDQITIWNFKNHQNHPGGDAYPMSWRVVLGQGLMPYEFQYRASNDRRNINLSDSKYQPFLNDFVKAVEGALLHDRVALILRPDKHKMTDKTYGLREISVSEGYRLPPDTTITWCFDPPKPGGY